MIVFTFSAVLRMLAVFCAFAIGGLSVLSATEQFVDRHLRDATYWVSEYAVEPVYESMCVGDIPQLHSQGIIARRSKLDYMDEALCILDDEKKVFRSSQPWYRPFRDPTYIGYPVDVVPDGFEAEPGEWQYFGRMPNEPGLCYIIPNLDITTESGTAKSITLAVSPIRFDLPPNCTKLESSTTTDLEIPEPVKKPLESH